MTQKICQSCSMPIDEEFYGDNEDGSLNEEYCLYCFSGGEFTEKVSMKQMIEICVEQMVEEGMSEKDSRDHLNKVLPTLKRWK